MPQVATLGSQFQGICYSHDSPKTVTGTVITGSGTVLTEGLPTARIGDTVQATCGHTGVIITGSSSHIVEGLPCAMVGSLVLSSSLNGKIITGSGTVISG